MKELVEMMKKDFREEGFTLMECIVVGVVAPLALIGLCVLPELLAEAVMKLAGV